MALIDSVVRNGVVELWGTITDERERQAIVVAAENVPGVKAVHDYLAWVEPTSGMVIYQPNEPPARRHPERRRASCRHQASAGLGAVRPAADCRRLRRGFAGQPVDHHRRVGRRQSLRNPARLLNSPALR